MAGQGHGGGPPVRSFPSITREVKLALSITLASGIVKVAGFAVEVKIVKLSLITSQPSKMYQMPSSAENVTNSLGAATFGVVAVAVGVGFGNVKVGIDAGRKRSIRTVIERRPPPPEPPLPPL